MLLTLNIENVAVIESAEISFGDRFNVLTGETGAGKSIVIDSINAILGERTSKDIIRNGCDHAVITAEFSVSDGVAAVSGELGYPCDDNTLVITRRLSTDGKNNIRINGKPANVSILRELGVHLINIHGQHDSQSLLNPESHLGFIDTLAENEEIFKEYIKNYRKLVDIKHQIKKLSESNDNNIGMKEMLEFQVNELESAEITAGEREKLEARRSIIKNSENIKDSIDFTKNSLIGSDDSSGIIDLVHFCSEKFESLANIDSRFCGFSERLKELEINSRDLYSDINMQLSEFDYDASELETIEKRLDLIYGLSLKYGKSEEKMLEFLSDAKEKLNGIINYDSNILKLEDEFSELLDKTKKVAEKLSKSRETAAVKFENSVCEQLKFLNMPYVHFCTEITKTKLTSRGSESLEFLISTNPGEPPKPLIKIASGGELSRIMLAIKTVLSRADTVESLIFDEIDSGISGNAAQKVGEKMKEISKNKQVICVTHLSQIAAMGDTHFLISKSNNANRSYTDISLLDRDSRINEIARIISGGEMTDNLRLTAEEMLNKALTY